MRVLVANNYYYLRGGAERVMFNDMNALTSRGVEVVPFSAIDPVNVPDQHSATFGRGVDVHATSLLPKIRAAREAVHCSRTAKAFAVLLDQMQPDMLHCHNIYGRLTTSILPEARQRGIPAVMSVHDYKLVCPAYLMLRNGKPCSACLDGHYYRCAVHQCHKQNLAASVTYTVEAYYARLTDSYGAISAFLCPSRFIGDLLVKSGIAASRVIYHPNGVEPTGYVPHYEGDYVLYTGRLSHEKGVATLIDAVQRTGIPLRIAGSGPLEQELRAKVLENGDSRITFEGHCTGDTLASLYRNAAFVAVPSEWYENAPMSVLEAFAYGKPVVGSRMGGIPELVVEAETGYLVEPGNSETLRTVLLNLWNDPQGRKRMGRNARQLVETRYSQDSRTASLLAIYASLQKSGGRPVGLVEPVSELCS